MLPTSLFSLVDSVLLLVKQAVGLILLLNQLLLLLLLIKPLDLLDLLSSEDLVLFICSEFGVFRRLKLKIFISSFILKP